MKICQAVLKLWSKHENCTHTKGNNSKSRKLELWFLSSARLLMVFNVCVKFHENMSSGFKVMELTQKLLRHTHTRTHTEKTKTLYPHGIRARHTSYAGGIKKISLFTSSVLSVLTGN